MLNTVFHIKSQSAENLTPYTFFNLLKYAIIIFLRFFTGRCYFIFVGAWHS